MRRELAIALLLFGALLGSVAGCVSGANPDSYYTRGATIHGDTYPGTYVGRYGYGRPGYYRY